MIELRDTTIADLSHIVVLEQTDAGRFILPYSLERHKLELTRPGIIYRSVVRDSDLVGFVILALESDGRSVEFRRIVIQESGRGIGTAVVRMVDDFARNELGRTRVWLDVFETNDRARHVYEKCGYRPFGRSEHEGRTLLLYEKLL